MPRLDPRATGGPLADLTRYSGLGIAFGATLCLFAGAGYWVDRKLGSSPWFLLLGVFLGFGLSLRSMLKKLPSGKPSHPAHRAPADRGPEARPGDRPKLPPPAPK